MTTLSNVVSGTILSRLRRSNDDDQHRGRPMGYAHDVLLDKNCDPAAFAAAVEDVRTLTRRIEIPIVGPSGRPTSRPTLEDSCIEFNGVNFGCVCPGDIEEGRGLLDCSKECFTKPNGFSKARDESYQPFCVRLMPEPGVFSRKLYRMPNGRFGDWFDCKTRRRPYDLLVMVSLIALKHHLGEAISVYSKATWPGAWSVGPGGFWSANPSLGAIQVYEYVFPDRAPVQNILDNDDDW